MRVMKVLGVFEGIRVMRVLQDFEGKFSKF